MARKFDPLSITRLRSRRAARASNYLAAIQRLDVVLTARVASAELASTLRSKSIDLKDLPASARRARAQVVLAKEMYRAGTISHAQYVYFASYPVLSWVHEARWLEGHYQSELNPIMMRMDEIRSEAGLPLDDDWPLGQGPQEYQRLNADYNAVLERKAIEVLWEFDLPDLADLFEQSSERFNRLNERGRRTVHHKDAQAQALRDAVDNLCEEAEKAAVARAFTLGAAAYGAAIEGLLALRCLRAPRKARRFATQVSKHKLQPNPLRWSFEVLIDACHAAGWLPPFESENFGHHPAGWAHYLRDLRNVIHPTKAVRDSPWTILGPADFENARAVYVVVSAVLQPRRGSTRRSSLSDT